MYFVFGFGGKMFVNSGDQEQDYSLSRQEYCDHRDTDRKIYSCECDFSYSQGMCRVILSPCQ